MEWTIEPGLPSAPIRREVRSYLEAKGAGARASDAEVVVGELVANILRHTGAGGRLRVEVADGVVRVDAIDNGTPLATGDRWPRDDHHAPEINALGGRGLWIARQFADELEVQRESSGNAVQARFGIDEPRGNA